VGPFAWVVVQFTYRLLTWNLEEAFVCAIGHQLRLRLSIRAHDRLSIRSRHDWRLSGNDAHRHGDTAGRQDLHIHLVCFAVAIDSRSSDSDFSIIDYCQITWR